MTGPTLRDEHVPAIASDLPHAPRVVVIGTSGAGKTTLARELALALRIPRIELDELFWSSEWRPKPHEAFMALVRAATDGPSWVVDGNYGVARPVIWPRANVVVWLNYPLPVVFWQGLKRTLRRWWRKEVLWHGNREALARTFLSRESILLWILTTHTRRTREFRQLRNDPRYAGIRWIEFRKTSDAIEWLKRVTA